MTFPSKTAAIVNPHSDGGRTARRWPRLAALLEGRLGPVTTRFTKSPGSGIALARELLRGDYDLVIAAGGDGTINEVANGFFEHDQMIRPQAALGILPLGTGGDFRRTLRIPADPFAAIKILAEGVPLAIDVGKVRFHANTGGTETRYFVNLVSFGMGGHVAARSRNVLRGLGGRAAFLWATLITFLSYRGRSVELRLSPDTGPLSFHVTNVAIGNGQFHGGGMRPCPTASLTDGMLEVTVIDYAGPLRLIGSLPKLYSGEVYSHPKVHHLRTGQLWADSSEETRVEIDGEALGTLPLAISLMPQQLRVVVSSSE